jgi:hypothetical protein
MGNSDTRLRQKFNLIFFGTVSRRTPVGVVDFGRREAPYYKANINSNF